jgi:hypothetical protein
VLIAASILKPELTAQEVFDHAVRYVSTMPTRCDDGDESCLYRSPDGKSACVVGAMLTVDEIKGSDGHIPFGDVHTIKSRLPKRLLPHINLLKELQLTHDDREMWLNWEQKQIGPADPKAMSSRLRVIAHTYGLSTSVIDEAFPASA